jgi:hypothetical protein
MKTLAKNRRLFAGKGCLTLEKYFFSNLIQALFLTTP